LIEAAFFHDHLGIVGTALFHAPAGLGFAASRWMELVGYLILVGAIAFSARLFVRIEHMVALRFRGIQVPGWVRPAVGAASAGAIALLVMSMARLADISAIDTNSPLGILGSGYGIIQAALDIEVGDSGRWTLVALFAVIALGKMIATACTVGSDGSGGEFAPAIVIGGCIGAAVGFALQGLPIAPHPGACVIMGMAGFLSATHRTPIAALLMVSEIIGNYHLLIPAMWVTSLSFLLSGRITVVNGQVASPIASPAHRGHFFSDLLAGILVSEAMSQADACHTLKPGSRLEECRELLRSTHQTVFPVVNEDGRFMGEVTLDDLRAFLYDQDLDLVAVAQDVMSAEKWSVTPRDTLAVAMRRFNSGNVDELPVVEPGTERFLGLLTRRQCIGHYNKLVDQLRAQRKAEGYDTETDD
jgi:CIC family chloride channel protein